MRDGDKDLSIFVAIAIITATLIVGNFATPSYGKKSNSKRHLNHRQFLHAETRRSQSQELPILPLKKRLIKMVICGQLQK
jgi:hypothetical protein